MLSNNDPAQDNSEYEALAALDLGSNSFHMVIAKVIHGEIRVLEKLGEKVQLAADIDDQGLIKPDAIDRAIECLKRFGQRIRNFDVANVQIVGTNALRVAKNRKQFIAQAEAAVGFSIDVISGREEARLIYLGVSHSMADDKGKRLVIDIGGGSTEFVIGERFESHLLESLHMGCVSYRDRYMAKNKISKPIFDKAVLNASRELLNIKQAYKKASWDSCVGSSGSIKAISAALSELGISDGSIELSGLKALKKRVLEYEMSDQLTDLGVRQDRCSVFPSGLAILYAAFKVLGIKKMIYTSGALREGLLYDMVGRNGHEDVRDRTISSLQQRYFIDQSQCERVEETVLHAFDQVAKGWGIHQKESRMLLVWASRIYELGLTISHTQHHKHGAYLIEHSDLPGFTDGTKHKLATIIRLHRRRFAPEVLESLDTKDQEKLRKLSVLFRLSVLLTASRVSPENAFSLTIDGNQVLTLDMGSGWLEKHPLTHANLENELELLNKAGIGLHLV